MAQKNEIVSLESVKNFIQGRGLASIFEANAEDGDGIHGLHTKSDLSKPVPVSFVLSRDINRLKSDYDYYEAFQGHSVPLAHGLYKGSMGDGDIMGILIIDRAPQSLAVQIEHISIDLYDVDVSTRKATQISSTFRDYLRKIRDAIHGVHARKNSYHGNVFEGLKFTSSGDMLLYDPQREDTVKDGLIKDIQDFKKIVMLMLEKCQDRQIHMLKSPTDYPPDLKCFFQLCDALNKYLPPSKGDKEEFIRRHTYYILHCPIFMDEYDLHSFCLKLWSIRGLNVKEFNSTFRGKLIVNEGVKRIKSNNILESVFSHKSPYPSLPPPRGNTYPPPPPPPRVPTYPLCPFPSRTDIALSLSLSPRATPRQYQPRDSSYTCGPYTSSKSSTSHPRGYPTHVPPPRQISASPHVPPIGPTQPPRPFQSPTIFPKSLTSDQQDMDGVEFLKTCRNSILHWSDHSREVLNVRGADEIEAIKHLRNTVSEGIPLMYNCIVDQLDLHAKTHFGDDLDQIMARGPYTICTCCKEVWRWH